MFNVGPSPAIQGGMGGQFRNTSGDRPRPQRMGMGPQYASNMSPDAGLSMMQRMRMPPPTRVPQGNMGGGPMMPPARPPMMAMPQIPPMMDGGGGMMMPPSNGGIDIGKLTGGTNTGVMGPRPGGLWNTYANMVQGDGAPQKRNLTY
jgi:hypothetical protein